MLDVDTKRIINNARDILVGKVPNPQSQVDLITIAMIYKFMDDMDLQNFEDHGKHIFFIDEIEPYAFHKLLDQKLGNQARLNLYAEALDKLPQAKSVPELFRTIFRGAFLPFRDPATLTMFLKEINNFSYDNSETLGNAFEYLLSIMGSQGDAGQFRTPRHIIDFIVNVVKPDKTDTILDPACGTAGFLISAYLYIKRNNPNMSVKEMQTLTDNIVGYDISPDMRKLALVNLYLHRFAEPKIYEYDTLTSDDRWGDKFDVILANPPFMTPKGGIQPHSRFSVKANRSEVLFVDYIAEHLTLNGRAGIIVPEGIIFQSATAYKALRKMLVDDHYLYAVISLPGGVFNPYSGVKTSILLFDRALAKQKKDILFVKIENDGFDLGAQRKPIAENNLPETVEIIEKWKKGEDISTFPRALVVQKEKIKETVDYNLMGNRYIEDSAFGNCQYELVALGDENYFSLESGGTPSTNNPEYWGGRLPWISLVDLPADDRITNITTTERTITEDGLKNSSARMLPIDTIVVSSRATIGRVGISKIPLATNQGFKNIIIKDFSKANPVYVANTIVQLKEQMENLASGGTFKEISKSNMATLKIPLPPIDVQRQIVEEIENKQQIIDNTRQTLRNLERERQYFAGLLDGIEYEEVALGDICEFRPKPNLDILPENSLVSFIPMATLNQNKKDFNAEETRSIKDVKTGYTCFENMDILLAKITPCFENGKSGVAQNLQNGIGFGSTEFIVMRANKLKVKPEWIYYFINSDNFLRIGADNMTGSAGQKRVPIDFVANYKIPLPSITDQKHIIAALDVEQKAAESAKQLIDLMQKKIDNVIKRIYKCEV